MALVLWGIILLIIVVGILFMNFSPQFGGAFTKEIKKGLDASPNYTDGKFVNEKPVNQSMAFGDMMKTMYSYFVPPPKTIPADDIPTQSIDSLDIVAFKDSTRLVWFGHSTFLMQTQNTNILIDPMFGAVPAPHPMLGSKRFSKDLPIDIAKLPQIDIVVISHDHFDHLDYGSIVQLNKKVKMFYTPLGVGVHLRKWGIEANRIVELDWWQETIYKGIELKCTPAQHFSGRTFSTGQSTLWSSWVIKSDKSNIFFSGDSGYGPHFKQIGEKYGPFDFAMLECGQYNVLWPDIHMFPEETVQAGIDVNARQIMPIHWGAFKLSTHSWTDPVERAVKKAKELDVHLITPKIGEPIFLNQLDKLYLKWWE